MLVSTPTAFDNSWGSWVWYHRHPYFDLCWLGRNLSTADVFFEFVIREYAVSDQLSAGQLSNRNLAVDLQFDSTDRCIGLYLSRILVWGQVSTIYQYACKSQKTWSQIRTCYQNACFHKADKYRPRRVAAAATAMPRFGTGPLLLFLIPGHLMVV